MGDSSVAYWISQSDVKQLCQTTSHHPVWNGISNAWNITFHQSLLLPCALDAHTCFAACRPGWIPLWLKTVVVGQGTEVSWSLGCCLTYPTLVYCLQGSWDCWYWPWGYPRPRSKVTSFIRSMLSLLLFSQSDTICVTHLTLWCIGNSPYRRNHRQRAWGLVSVLLPGNAVIWKGPITTKQCSNSNVRSGASNMCWERVKLTPTQPDKEKLPLDYRTLVFPWKLRFNVCKSGHSPALEQKVFCKTSLS